MTDTLSLKELHSAATLGPWEVETEHDPDAEYGPGPDCGRGFDNFVILTPEGEILSTANSANKCIEEESWSDEDGGGVDAWDSIGKANAALIVAAVNALPDLLAAVEALPMLTRCLVPVTMGFAQAECVDEPIPDDAVVLSFMGSGASDQVTAGEVRAALTAARTALDNLRSMKG